jgi:hypothetical protein
MKFIFLYLRNIEKIAMWHPYEVTIVCKRLLPFDDLQMSKGEWLGQDVKDVLKLCLTYASIFEIFVAQES